jgi:hypothetical protein
MEEILFTYTLLISKRKDFFQKRPLQISRAPQADKNSFAAKTFLPFSRRRFCQILCRNGFFVAHKKS